MNHKVLFNKLEFLCNKKKNFLPTGTSQILADCAIKLISNKNKKVLDFGCGIGVVGISIFKKKKIKSILYASDISKNSVEFCKLNAEKHKIKINAKSGTLFEPWKDHKFDLIINDISGISQEISKISPWFKNVSCESGIDGSILTNKVITQGKKFLNKKGKIIFPIISLANKKKILLHAKKKFKKITLLSSQTWPMPKEFYKHKKLLSRLKKKKFIDFQEKFGILTFSTEVYLIQ